MCWPKLVVTPRLVKWAMENVMPKAMDGAGGMIFHNYAQILEKHFNVVEIPIYSMSLNEHIGVSGTSEHSGWLWSERGKASGWTFFQPYFVYIITFINNLDDIYLFTAHNCVLKVKCLGNWNLIKCIAAEVDVSCVWSATLHNHAHTT